MMFRITLLALTLAFTALQPWVHASESADDQRFLQAREAFSKGNAIALHDAVNRLDPAHPLAIYA